MCKRSVELLGSDQDIEKLKSQTKEVRGSQRYNKVQDSKGPNATALSN